MTKTKHVHVLGLHEIDRSHVDLVGGKAANLGELSRLPQLRVPAGFCVTTAAFNRFVATNPAIGTSLDRLAKLTADDRDVIREQSAALRRIVAATRIPDDLLESLTRAIARLGADDAHAVRSSATAEDLPGASFAGQQDTYLNVRGEAVLVEHIRRCWASLYSERAVSYRIRHGFDHRKVHMAVVVQKLIPAQAAGLLFTADPVSSDRKLSAIEANFGLGEALVSGLTAADRYEVRAGQILSRAIASKTLATRAVEAGGTEDRPIAGAQQTEPVLTDAQIVALERLGRQIEAHFGQPQDIEWCLSDGTIHIVQSRPITTLYPIPAANEPGNRVFLSVGHQQMMTDAMKPLGLSVFQLTAAGPMLTAGGRLFVDPTRALASPATRDGLLAMIGRGDPPLRDALLALVNRGDAFFEGPTPGEPTARRPAPAPAAPDDDDQAAVAALIQRSQASLDQLAHDIFEKTGPELFDFILADMQQQKHLLADPQSMRIILAGMDATAWINRKMLEWLDEKTAADTLAQSVDHNITSSMGLALMDVADAIRPHPEVIAFLENVQNDDSFLEKLPALPGGPAAHDAIAAFLERHGMRCVGEIDITRPRWSERPTTLLPLILRNIRSFAPHAGAQRFAQGRQEALQRAQALLDRLRRLPDGEQKAEEARRAITRMRDCIGFREYPKYGLIRRYFLYKQALLREGDRLVQAGVVADVEDLYFLTFHELREVVRTQQLDPQLINERKAEYEHFKTLTPPRVITSDGEVLKIEVSRAGAPAGALVGLAVSSGVVEGRARVLTDLADADLTAGDILVTRFTDPSWTPLFVLLKGLVTEVGGLMTHGAVIAREYGLPAVVGVEHATTRIRDGQRIRVHGTDGYVELLP